MEQPQFSFTRQIKALWRYKGRIILVAVVAGIAALILTAMKPLTYEATTKLMAGNGQQRLTAMPSGIPGGLELTYLQDVGNQIELMKSRTVLEKAVSLVEPQKAANPDTLQLEVRRLESTLSIRQVETTNLVTITVVSTDPASAREWANAVANAYIDHLQMITTTTIENALEGTKQQLEDLQKASVELSISPTLPRLIAQINTALPALQAASDTLRQIEKMDAASVAESTASPTASQLNAISLRVSAVTLEANDITALALEVSPVAEGNDFSSRSSAIAVIESRTRALVTKLDDLSEEITSLLEPETDVNVQSQLVGVNEQLQIASATGQAILDQVVSLYRVQEEYIAANTSVDPSQVQAQNQAKAQAKEADANLLNRIVNHNTVLTETLKVASGRMAEVKPPEIVNTTSWLYGALASQADLVSAVLQDIMQKLQPSESDSEILLTHADLSSMEFQARMMTQSLSSLFTQMSGLQSDAVDQDIARELLSAQESISIANNAAGGLGDDIASLAQTGGDSTSYTALNTLRQELQLALLSGDTTGTRIIDTAVTSQATSIFARYRGVLLAIIAGLFVGSLGVLLIQYFDRTVRDPSQLTGLGIPLMASIAPVKSDGPGPSSLLDESHARFLESFRLLRTNLGLDSAKGKIVLVTSPQSGEGKTIVAANLARAVALLGRKVLLIDANLHHPDVATAFGLAEDGNGLSELLTRGDEVKNYITESHDVFIIRGGKPSTTSAELFASPRLKALLETSRQYYDVVIIDSAPIMEWTDTRVLARNVDGVVMVLQNNSSNLDLARESQQALAAAGVNLEGFVLLTGGLAARRLVALKEPVDQAA
jgi:capsular exopolysaccharide synthesis family protein